MKIVIDRKTLADALSEVLPFAPSKSPIAILKNVKIVTKGSRIKFEANDTQASVRRYAEAIEIDQDGSFLVDCADLASLVSKCKGNEIALIVENDTLTVKHSKGSAVFQIMRVGEYPDFDMPSENTTEITVPCDMLCDCIVTARGFVGTDDLRAMLKPIYAYVKNGEFGYCATDTRRMVTGHNAIENPGDTDIHWYIEPFVFSALLKAAKDVQDAVVKITPQHVSYRLGNTVIQTVQTIGKYPDFNRVIPKEWAMECVVDREELMDSLKRAAMLCEDNRLAKLDISPMDMTITTDNLVKMKKSSEVLQHNGCNGSVKIGMHIDFLLVCLGTCTSNEVILCMTDASRPMLIRQADKPNMVLLQMPMTIQN